uniref:Uncharacterized protein n=1 Tax=Astyanax mexicanus TaxID=7994 RepID=A0A8B9HLD0_ASTMX
MVSVPQQPEVAVAQRLASNERPVRTRALKTLKKYINLRSQTGIHTHTLTLSPVLSQCALLLQYSLSSPITMRFIITVLSLQSYLSALYYYSTSLQSYLSALYYYSTSLQSYYSVLYYYSTFALVLFLAVFTAELLQSAVRVPDGLMLHILELYMTELARVGSAELKAEQNLTFIQPFCKTISETKDRSVLSSVCKHIFSTILDHASYAVEELMKELSDGGEDSGAAEEESVSGVENDDEDSYYELMDLDNEDLEEDDSDDDVGPVLQFDYGALADCLFELGSRPLTPNFNRNKIYKLVKTFRDLSEGKTL